MMILCPSAIGDLEPIYLKIESRFEAIKNMSGDFVNSFSNKNVTKGGAFPTVRNYSTEDKNFPHVPVKINVWKNKEANRMTHV